MLDVRNAFGVRLLFENETLLSMKRRKEKIDENNNNNNNNNGTFVTMMIMMINRVCSGIVPG
jgi:hypothetical protein